MTCAHTAIHRHTQINITTLPTTSGITDSQEPECIQNCIMMHYEWYIISPLVVASTIVKITAIANATINNNTPIASRPWLALVSLAGTRNTILYHYYGQ